MRCSIAMLYELYDQVASKSAIFLGGSDGSATFWSGRSMSLP